MMLYDYGSRLQFCGWKTILALVIGLGALAAGRAGAEAVTNTADSGTGSLRQALLDANAGTGGSSITFNIPNTDAGFNAATGTWSIALQSLLPTVNVPVTVDGTTQPGFNGKPMIELNGSAATTNSPQVGGGLDLAGGNSTVKGLVINRFPNNGIFLEQNGNDRVQGCYIGTDATGTISLPNMGLAAVFVDGTDSNTIGGATTAQRNIISGSGTLGLAVKITALSATSNSPSGNIVQGNFIGTDVTGEVALPNLAGVQIIGAQSTQVVNNVICGASGVIILSLFNVFGANLDPMTNTVKGNIIGLDAAGTKILISPIPAAAIQEGVIIQTTPGVPVRNIIGGADPASRNVIAGFQDGVALFSTANTVEGNFIGTDITGKAIPVFPGKNAAIGNLVSGVSVNGGDHNVIGVSGAGNVIAGNGDPAQTSPTSGYGVLLVLNGSKRATSNAVQANFIGTDLTGITHLGNLRGGILVTQADMNVIGGTAAGNGNTIAFNGGPGVTVGVNAQDASVDNSIQQNSIFANTRLGIDLGSDGVTPNTAGGPHTGPNFFQNFPVITGLAGTGTNTMIMGTLNGTPSTSFTVEVYASATGDPSGFGQGQFFLGSVPVMTDAGGNGSFSLPVSSPPPGLNLATSPISATATDPAGNTSEFAKNFILQAPALTPTTTTLMVSPNPATAGQTVTLTAAVSGTGGTPTGTVTFMNGSTAVGMAGLTNGQAALTTTSLAVGSDSLTAVYSGDATFATSTSTAVPVTITAQPAVLHTYTGVGWHLISSPFATSQALTSLNPNVFVWDPVNMVYNFPPAGFQVGTGYWMYLKTSSQDIPGPGTPIDNTKPFTISLSTGWNLVGEPFTSPIPLSQISVMNSAGSSTPFSTAAQFSAMLVTPLFTWDPNSMMYNQLDMDGETFNPWDGAWIFAKKAGLSLVFTPQATR